MAVAESSATVGYKNNPPVRKPAWVNVALSAVGQTGKHLSVFTTGKLNEIGTVYVYFKNMPAIFLRIGPLEENGLAVPGKIGRKKCAARKTRTARDSRERPGGSACAPTIDRDTHNIMVPA